MVKGEVASILPLDRALSVLPGSCFKYDARCLQLIAGGDGFAGSACSTRGARDFLQEVVNLRPLRPGEAERSIFRLE